MTDKELIEAHDAAAIEILHSKRFEGKPMLRADELEGAIRHLVCSAILSGEVSMDRLNMLATFSAATTPVSPFQVQ